MSLIMGLYQSDKTGNYSLSFGKNGKQAFEMFVQIAQGIAESGQLHIESPEPTKPLTVPTSSTATLRQAKRSGNIEERVQVTLNKPSSTEDAVREMKLREHERRRKDMSDLQQKHSDQRAEIVEAVTELAKMTYGDAVTAQMISSFYTEIYKELAQEYGDIIPKGKRNYVDIGEYQESRLNAMIYEDKGDIMLRHVNRRIRGESNRALRLV
ncbi:hypothetical protein M6D81_11325 [Paenibacillus sp. J5C_2022]|uniref:hypothetical protein n=1 Tax=Paenibacillus sp. J5C2022 TaxID=2977129 RepID=UPI0021CF7667|nr:hypothetical protein [Paenibacillus sp. J5C2022]MCU6709297.1 hypothetical protein [Paenibacillus sp. J5C2022]